MASTGLRIGEAIGLAIEDVRVDVLRHEKSPWPQEMT
jgi:hypothetical protein